ncbi:MAG: ATP-binding cassette domain-containing protein [Sulfurimonas sp.]|uniref:ABC transporter ATP-binding protein n=1 Tax=Sulfurimonas sp. TaxID=2022749 RepID=UPI0026280170|nr:ATP-binding cassette domain-containing protein [Sulfurimonas sp.]MCW8895663.1 ATP-binding cassette domain-containing protein [Sulfurimonas sp.]MCW8955184.1 ATP-binding cassette domain-containing protein [Sulfurimonas sp.]MCW9066903.1 ATP-binding cassette domain-containing protein [Sulfurimonas sp.]
MIHIAINKKLHGASADMQLDVNFEIKDGDFVALSGKSGSGKTTLLRILAGLEEANGIIHVEEEIWLDNNICKAVQKREIGFVFQDYALFDNMSVLQNLLYVKKDLVLANHLLHVTELTELKDRSPSTLSGGQKQRVALCRAMMKRPKILLLDEPLSALDPVMRSKLQNEIIALHKEFKTTTIMVSHDPSEIYRLSNRVLVLEDGKIINDGSTKDVLLRTKGSQKFSFEGELLEIKKVDVIFIAIIAIGQQLVEVVVGEDETKNLNIGDVVNVSTKAFSPTITQ